MYKIISLYNPPMYIYKIYVYICSLLWCMIGQLDVEKQDRCWTVVVIDPGFLFLLFPFDSNFLSCIPPIIYFILEFRNCSMYTFAQTPMHTCTHTQESKHFSWLPLSCVAILRVRLAWHWRHFIWSLIVFRVSIIAWRFVCSTKRKHSGPANVTLFHLSALICLL